MKYGVIPSNIFERIALWSGKVPVPLFDSIYSIMKVRSLMAAVKLGVFEALRDGPLMAAEVAGTCKLNESCTESLLRLLAATEYLEHDDGRFRLSELSRNTLLAGAGYEM